MSGFFDRCKICVGQGGWVSHFGFGNPEFHLCFDCRGEGKIYRKNPTWREITERMLSLGEDKKRENL